jgi:maltose alpha-D-glucosyltransferase/alpha-amylase
MENDLDRVKLMNGMLLSMPGSPIIYYGDEIGMGDNVFVGDRNGVRTPMQWSPDRNAGFSRADPQRLYLQPIMDPMYGYEALNVETQARDASSLLNWMQAHAGGAQDQPRLRARQAALPEAGQPQDPGVPERARRRRDPHRVQPLARGAAGGARPVGLQGPRARSRCWGAPRSRPSASCRTCSRWPRTASTGSSSRPRPTMPSWHHQGVALQDRPVLVLFDGWTSFFRDRVMPWRIGMAERMRNQFETETLPRHIEIQRWYASKGTPIARARLVDHAVWEANGHSWMLPLLDLDGPPAAPPTSCRWPSPGKSATKSAWPAWRRPRSPRCASRRRSGVMGDAFFDEAFCRALVRAISQGAELPHRQRQAGVQAHRPPSAR